jgi:ribokinase
MFVVIGSLTADLLIRADDPAAVAGEDGFRAGNLAFTDTPTTITMGGNGGNSAYVLGGLGVPTALCSAVGQDLLGSALLDWLTERSVHVTGITRSNAHATSTSTIIMTGPSNQLVFHYPGAYSRVTIDDIPTELLGAATTLLMTSYPIMSGLRPHGYRTALAAVRRAGGLTAVDLGPAIATPVTLAELAPLLPDIDLLIGNAHELETATGTASWESAADALLAAGASRVVIKQGAAGAAVRTATERFHEPGFPVEAGVSVGAGDSFNAGLLFGLDQNWPIDRAVRYGNAVAAMVVGGQGILDSPEPAQVDAFLETHPRR